MEKTLPSHRIPLELLMSDARQGFRELEHTADWELQIWAPNLPALFEQAATGMYQLAGTELESGPRVSRRFELSAADPEGLLVLFLSELLYWGEAEGLGFDEFSIQIVGDTLQAEISGARIAGQQKEIKAVTFHQLEIQTTSQGLEVNVVFDV